MESNTVRLDRLAERKSSIILPIHRKSHKADIPSRKIQVVDSVDEIRP